MESIGEHEVADNVEPTKPFDKTKSLPSMTRSHTMPMRYFLDSRNLDPETAALLQEYDANGDGVFDKTEVVAILLELRERGRENAELRMWNDFLRRVTVTMSVVFVILLLGFIGMSVAVTVITAKVNVEADGTALSAADPSIVIATSSRATLFQLHHDDTVNDGSIYCIEDETAESIISLYKIGKKVNLELLSEDGTPHQVVELAGTGAEYNPISGRLTYDTMDNKTLLMQTNEQCGIQSSGERRIGVSYA